MLSFYIHCRLFQRSAECRPVEDSFSTHSYLIDMRLEMAGRYKQDQSYYTLGKEAVYRACGQNFYSEAPEY